MILNFVEDNRWKYLVTGLGNTLKITLAAVLLGIVIGTLVAIVRSTWDQNAERMRPGAGKSLLHIGDMICKIYLTVIRGTPVVVQLMIMFYIIFATSRNGVGVAMLAFGVNSGAYVAELIRGGIMAIDKGQLEAGRSLGFDYVQKKLLEGSLDKSAVLNKTVVGGATCSQAIAPGRAGILLLRPGAASSAADFIVKL